MKRILKHLAVVVMVIAAVVGLDPKASGMQIGMSFTIAFLIAGVFLYQWDKEENQRKSP